MHKVVIFKHPLIDHKMAKLRNKKTGTKEFRETLSELGGLITYEITRDLKTKAIEIETPMAKTQAFELENDVVIVPILRAGIGMVEGIQNLIPTAKVGHIGLYRDEETLEPREYYSKLPQNMSNSVVLLVDPMLATGGTVAKAIDIIKESGAKEILYVGVVGAPEGVKLLEEKHPDVPVYLAALDTHLDENSYIIPGLGDCGDRLFGTK